MTEDRGQITDEGPRTGTCLCKARIQACESGKPKGLPYKRHALYAAGFTLIETIITLVVLSIAAVGVLTVFTVGISGSADPLILSQATSLAQERVDTIMGDRLNPARGFNYILPGNYPAENPVTGFAAFNRSTNIFCVTAIDLNTNTGAPPCASGYAHVTVTVTHAVTGSVSLITVVTNY